VLALLAACGSSARDCPDAPPAIGDASTDAPPDAATGLQLVLMIGQSNAGSQGLVSELADPTLAQPYPAVQFAEVIGLLNGAPVTYPLGPLQPYPGLQPGNPPAFGFELSMGRELDAHDPGRWAIAKYSIGSTTLGGSWPTTGSYDPVGSPVNLYTAANAFGQKVAQQAGATLAAIVWIQGESDAVGAAESPYAVTYGVRLAEQIGAERFTWRDRGVPFIYGRLNVNAAGAGVADVRAGQEANQGPLEIMVDQDPYPLRSDMAHYTTESVVDLGRVYADAVLQR
jgi:hypothetical protein